MVFWLPARGFHIFLGAGDPSHFCLVQNRWQLLETGVQRFPSLTFRFGAAAADVATTGGVEVVSIR
jgi:hypothetical protein